MGQIQFSLITKIKIGRPEQSLGLPLRPIMSHFCPNFPPPKWTSCVMRVICASPLKT